MRRAVTGVMSGVSLVVVGLSLRVSEHGSPAALSPGPTAVVQSPTAAPGEPASASPLPSVAPTLRTGVRPGPGSAPSSSARPASITVNGAAADTPYGPVQLQIVVSGGRVVRADAIDYPAGGGRDLEINSRAVPQLNREALRAQSAVIDTVSGASYTSAGYRQSLQSALDSAHLAGAR